MINSVWNEAASLPQFSRLEGDCKTDVLVIGGGMAGLLTAHALAQAGVDYLLIEADEICCGVTRNTTAKITSQHGLIYDSLIRKFGAEKARLYWETNENALGQLRKLSQTIPCDFEEKPSYIYSVDQRGKLEQELAALEQLQIRADFAEALPLPFPVAGAVRFPNQAQFHPRKFAAGIAEGLNICEHTAALRIEGNTVLTDRGNITASKIIVATHFPFINKHGMYFLKMYQDRSYVLALENAPDLGGMYLDEAAGGLSFRNHNGLLLLGGGGHRTGKQGGGWARLDACAKVYYPDAQEKFRWATQDCMTLDDLPYIGQYSKNTPDLYVATGFRKWGMTTSMTAASVLADLVQGKENPYTALFDPTRRILRPQLLLNAAQATMNLLTPTKPRCPHMGCALKWNQQEHSWDCPCHGSRFSENGKLLDNPATGDLKK